MKKVLLGAIAIIICFALVSCDNGKKVEPVKSNNDIVIEKNENNENNETENTEEVEDDNQIVFEPKVLVSDDTKYVVKISEISEYTYYHDGNQITGLQTKMNYGTPMAAEYAKQTIESDELTSSDIESLTVEGSSLIIEYKENLYQNDTLESIKAVYEPTTEVSE